MLARTKKQVYLSKIYRKILHVLPSINDTFSLLVIQNKKEYKLIHLDAKGQIIWDFKFATSVDTLRMMKQDECIILEPKGDSIWIISLSSKKSFKVQHNFMFKEFDRSDLFLFPQTNIYAIIQRGNVNNQKLRITYARYPSDLKCQGKNQQFVQIKKLYQFDTDNRECFKQINQFQYTNEHKVVKGNNRSLVCWFLQNSFLIGNQIKFQMIQLAEVKDGMKPNHFTIKMGQCIFFEHFKDIFGKSQKGKDSMNHIVQSIFKIGVNKYIIELSSHISEKSKTIGLIYQNANEIQHSYQEIQIPDIKQKRGCFVLKTLAFGSYIYVSTVTQIQKKNEEEQEQNCFDKSQELSTNASYFLSTEDLKLIKLVQSKQSHAHNSFNSFNAVYQKVDYDTDLLIENYYSNSQSNQFQSVQQRIIQPKCITLFFLLNIYPDFDEDLLMDVVQIIDYRC